MTTNNHPANGPVSLDRLHQISEILSKAAAQSDGGNLGYAMADAVKVIDGAIAEFGAEPVAWTTGRYSQNIGCNFGEKVPDEAPCIMSIYWDIDTFRAHTDCDATALRWLEEAIKNTGAKPLYTAPPAPVVPEVMADPDESQYGGTYDEDYRAECAYVEGWNACRAALLQAGNSPVALDAYEIKSFGFFSATEGIDGLTFQMKQFCFESGSIPKTRNEGMVPKFALQAIINRLQDECDIMECNPLIDILSPSAAPQQEDVK